MTIVSIDFSILYPGVCICRDFRDFKWLAVVNTKLGKKESDQLDWIEANYPNLKLLKTLSKRKKDEQYHITERIKLQNYLEATELLVNAIVEEVKNDQELIVVLEGISFGSSGNSLVDISQATGILKYQLVEKLLNKNIERFFVFSPSELKNAIGCKGNANKQDILAKFKTDPIIESVKKSDLFRLVNGVDWIEREGKIISPIIDMIDSYLGVAKIYSLSK